MNVTRGSFEMPAICTLMNSKEGNNMYIITGLGNPGSKYAHTRHNVGFDAIDKLAEKYHINIDTKKFKGEYGMGYIEGQKVLLLKPQTYMNLSGECLQEVISYFKIDPEEELIVLFDDISLAPGLIRIRKKGSAGGHNGVKNIILHCGTQNFKRVKIGVGEKPKNWDLADYVLSRFPDEDRAQVEEAMDNTADAVKMMLADEVEAAMNKYNRKSPAAEPAKTAAEEK